MKAEITIKCNNGTQLRVRYSKTFGEYVVEARNDIRGYKISANSPAQKKKWIQLESQPIYSDALDAAFDEARQVNAIEGSD